MRRHNWLLLVAILSVPLLPARVSAMFINRLTNEINFKVIYYGPQFAGKGTTLRSLHKSLPATEKGEMLEVLPAGFTEKTIFFEFTPETPPVQGYRVRLQLYALTGLIKYERSRELILKGADAVVFVVDSQRDRIEANIQAFETMKKYLGNYGRDWKQVPLVFQFNKRDLANAASIADLKHALGIGDQPCIEADPRSGAGTFEVIKAVLRDILTAFGKGQLVEWKAPEKK